MKVNSFKWVDRALANLWKGGTKWLKITRVSSVKRSLLKETERYQHKENPGWYWRRKVMTRKSKAFWKS